KKEGNETVGVIILGLIYSVNMGHLIIPALVLILVVGILANGFIIGIIYTNSSLKNPKNILISHLCLIDLVGLAFSPYFITRLAMGSTAPISLESCLVQYYFLNLYSCVAVFMVSFMAIDRFLVICYPFLYELKVSNENIHKFMFLCWSLAIIYPTLYIFPFIGSKVCYLVTSYSFLCTGSSIESSACNPDTILFSKYYRIVMIALHFIGSLLIVTCSYIKILQESRSARLSESSRKALNTVVTHGIILLVFFGNSCFMFITGSLQIRDPSEESVLAILRLTADVLYLNVPPAINPIIYGLRNEDMRREFTKFFWRKKTNLVK
uniref:Olfactory receptor n=1 Tax=Latimeria chalumnae TaxID=7897 RepID=H3AAV7_LATCH